MSEQSETDLAIAESIKDEVRAALEAAMARADEMTLEAERCILTTALQRASAALG